MKSNLLHLTGTFVDIPPAYIDTHVAQCMLELDYYMKGLWHGAHFGRERRQKFTERSDIS